MHSRTLSGEGFSAFITDLHISGYKTDPEQIASAYRLALLIASDRWPGGEQRLGNLLAPVFAQNPAQQYDIRRRVDAWSDRLFRKSDAPEEAPKITDPTWSNRDLDIALTIDTPGGGVKNAISSLSLATIAKISATIVAFCLLCLVVPALVIPRSPSDSFFNEQTPQPRPGDNASAYGAVDWTLIIPTFFALLPSVVVMIFVILTNTRRRDLIRYASSKPRDLAEINILAPDFPVFEWPEMELAVRDLMRPVRIQTEQLDLERSVDATARASGLPTMVARALSVTSEYAVLVEDGGANDHIARLSDIALERLRAAGLITDLYRVVGPDIAYDRLGRRISLETVAATHQGDRLLIVGPGEAIADPLSGRLAPALGVELGMAAEELPCRRRDRRNDCKGVGQRWFRTRSCNAPRSASLGTIHGRRTGGCWRAPTSVAGPATAIL